MVTIEVKAPITGSVWKINVEVGQAVVEDQDVIILESMKMEIPILAPEDGVVKEIQVTEGSSVTEGDVVILMEEC